MAVKSISSVNNLATEVPYQIEKMLAQLEASKHIYVTHEVIKNAEVETTFAGGLTKSLSYYYTIIVFYGEREDALF